MGKSGKEEGNKQASQQTATAGVGS